ncbi:hypothetical protein QL285_080781 [Trifolium repens]|jgi:hypothetical protein|nr:hypothetical protein QL285_080781 [Trifolium repens]
MENLKETLPHKKALLDKTNVVVVSSFTISLEAVVSPSPPLVTDEDTRRVETFEKDGSASQEGERKEARRMLIIMWRVVRVLLPPFPYNPIFFNNSS